MTKVELRSESNLVKLGSNQGQTQFRFGSNLVQTLVEFGFWIRNLVFLGEFQL